eukprot:Gb_21539 [translate_table: standard]
MGSSMKLVGLVLLLLLILSQSQICLSARIPRRSFGRENGRRKEFQGPGQIEAFMSTVVAVLPKGTFMRSSPSSCINSLADDSSTLRCKPRKIKGAPH